MVKIDVKFVKMDEKWSKYMQTSQNWLKFVKMDENWKLSVSMIVFEFGHRP
jgi:hypothetical protein